jgi:hypothetical protein
MRFLTYITQKQHNSYNDVLRDLHLIMQIPNIVKLPQRSINDCDINDFVIYMISKNSEIFDKLLSKYKIRIHDASIIPNMDDIGDAIYNTLRIRMSTRNTKVSEYYIDNLMYMMACHQTFISNHMDGLTIHLIIEFLIESLFDSPHPNFKKVNMVTCLYMDMVDIYDCVKERVMEDFIENKILVLNMRNKVNFIMAGVSISTSNHIIMKLYDNNKLSADRAIILSICVSKFKYNRTSLHIFALKYCKYISTLTAKDQSRLCKYINSISSGKYWSNIVNIYCIPIKDYDKKISKQNLDKLKSILNNFREVQSYIGLGQP